MRPYTRREILMAALCAGVERTANASPTPARTIRITNCYGVGIGPHMSRQELEYAARCSLCLGGIDVDYSDAEQIRKTNANLRQIRQINPQFRLLEYTGAPDAPLNTPNMPKDAWLRYTDGSIVKGWPGSAMLNLGQPEVVEWLAKRCLRHSSQLDLDGVFLDSMSPWFDSWECNLFKNHTLHFQSNGTGRYSDLNWLNSTWRQAKTTLAARVRELVGKSCVVMANQAGREAAPWLNGVLLEDYVNSVIKGKRTWQEAADICLWWLTHAQQPVLTTLSCGSGVQCPYNAWKLPQQQQTALLQHGFSQHKRMVFGLATALLLGAYYSYDLSTRWRGQHWWYPEYDVDLGKPVGDSAQQTDGSWQRRFSRGLAAVNPGKAAVTIRTQHTMKDVSSGHRSNTFMLAGLQGIVLVN